MTTITMSINQLIQNYLDAKAIELACQDGLHLNHKYSLEKQYKATM